MLLIPRAEFHDVIRSSLFERNELSIDQFPSVLNLHVHRYDDNHQRLNTILCPKLVCRYCYVNFM